MKPKFIPSETCGANSQKPQSLIIMSRNYWKYVTPAIVVAIAAIITVVYWPSRQDGVERISVPAEPTFHPQELTDSRKYILDGASKKITRNDARKRLDEPKSQSRSPEALIMNSNDLSAAIEEMHKVYGNTKEVAYAENFASGACQRDPDPDGTISTHTSDSLRAWAIARFLQQCKGMKNLPSTDAYINFVPPAKIAKDQGLQIGIEAAMQIIRSSDQIPELEAAGDLFVENGLFPSMQIPGLDPNLGAPDFYKSWVLASELWACDQNGGCGPDNFRTVAYCMVAGCPQGSDFRKGLSASLSERDTKAISAFYQWIASNR